MAVNELQCRRVALTGWVLRNSGVVLLICAPIRSQFARIATISLVLKRFEHAATHTASHFHVESTSRRRVIFAMANSEKKTLLATL